MTAATPGPDGPRGEPPARPVEIHPVPGIPEVRPGDDLAHLLLTALSAAGLTLADGDVLAVTSKIVAKSEGRLVPLPPDEPARTRVRESTVAAESVRTVAHRGPILITETHHGFVGANALVDGSNTGGDQLVLLPEDPDASAAALRARVAAETGRDVAVILTDTLGRPWRVGQTDVAVGLAGMGAIDDYRGRTDDDGRVLEATEIAVADELASAAELVKRKTARTPVALVRGARLPAGAGRARDLVRAPADDLFRVGAGAEQLTHFVGSYRPQGRFTGAPVDDTAVRRAASAALTLPAPDGTWPLRIVQVAAGPARERHLDALAPGRRQDLLRAAPVLLLACLAPGGEDAPAGGGEALLEETLVAAGGALRALLLALHAEGLAAAWIPGGPDAHASAAGLGLPAGWRALGWVAAGHPDPDADRAPDAGRPAPPVDELLAHR